jgi:hypothetical protein
MADLLQQPPTLPFGDMSGIGLSPTGPGVDEIASLAASVPRIKKPGFLARITSQPGGNDALIALGAGLLSGRDFNDGLARGLTAYQATLRQAKLDSQPKFSLINNGEFTAREVPGEGITLTPNDPVQARNDDKLETAFNNKLDLQQLRDENLMRRLHAQFGHQVDIENLRQKAMLGDHAAQRQLQWAIANLQAETSRKVAAIGATSRGNRPPPPAALAKHTELSSSLSRVGSTRGDVGRILGYIEDGQLDLSLLGNLRQKAALAGIPFTANDQTPTYGEFAQLLERMRNTRLLENVGVQTDGDAVRAYNELVAGTGNERSVLHNLRIVARELERQERELQGAVGRYESTYGIEGGSAPPPAARRTNGTTSTGVSWRVVK